MAQTKGSPKGKKTAEPIKPAPRNTVLNLKGSKEQSDWLELVHRRTHIPKSTIARLGLALWAKQNGHPPFPSSESDD